MSEIYIQEKKINLLLYDFDGVMTDNRVILNEKGQESVVCNRSDGLAVSIIKKWEVLQAIISTETNKIVATRAAKLKIPVIYGVSNKKETVIKYCSDLGIKLEETLYIGNDINDLEVMKIVGYAVCPNDAYDEIRKTAKLVLPVNGGFGVIRELIKYLTKEL